MFDPLSSVTRTEKGWAASLNETANRLRATVYEKHGMDEVHVASVRNAIPFVFDREVREKLDIYPNGRQEVEGDRTILWASPMHVDRTARYQPDRSQHLFLEQMDLFRRGAPVVWDWFKGGYKKPGEIWPSKPVELARNKYLLNYEKKLFQKIILTQDTLFLMNPSIATLWAAQGMNFRIICEESWRQDYRATLQKMQVPECFSSIPKDKMVYLGSNGPDATRFVPRWCCYTRNIFRQLDDGQPHHWEERDDHIMYWYMRKGREIRREFEYEPRWNRYSPATVDRAFGQDGMQYYVETNADWRLVPQTGHSSPVLWAEQPCPEGLTETDTMVWDHGTEGTYLSRRWRVKEYARSVGKVVCTLSRHRGAHPVSLSSNKLETLSYSFQGNPVALPVHRLDKVENGIKVIVIHERSDCGQPFHSVPGLYFSEVMWKDKVLEWVDGLFFVCRGLSDAMSHQLDLIRHFFRRPFDQAIHRPYMLEEDSMPAPRSNEIREVVQQVQDEGIRKTVLEWSQQTFLSARYMYQMLAAYPSIALERAISPQDSEWYRKASVDDPTFLRHLKGDIAWHRMYVVPVYQRMGQLGYVEEGEFLHSLRHDQIPKPSRMFHLPYLIWRFNLPVVFGRRGDGQIWYEIINSVLHGALDSIRLS